MGKREKFLTAKSIQRRRKASDPEWVPEALDWPLPAKLHGVIWNSYGSESWSISTP
jgi:hypothetical protein